VIKKILLNNKNLIFFDQGMVSGSNFISTLLIARMLGLNDFGIFSTLWLVLLIINSIYMSLIVLPMMTLVPKQKKLSEYFSHLFFIQILFIAFVMFFSFFVAFFYMDFLKLNINIVTILLFVLMVALYHMQDFYRRYFFAIKKYIKVLIIDFLSYISRVIILIVVFALKIKLSLNLILIIFNFTFFFGVLIGVFNYKIIYNIKNLKVTVLEHWKISKWLLPSGFMQWTSINLFIVLASLILGPIAVGAIKIGQNIAMAFNVILQGMENFIPLNASKVYIAKKKEGLIKYLQKVSVIGLFVVILFGTIISLFSKDLILILYGKKYIDYYYIIIWYSLILIFMYIILIIRVYLRTINNTKIWYKAYIITSGYALMISYPLLKFCALNGVMFGILTAHLVLIISVYFLLKRERKYVLS